MLFAIAGCQRGVHVVDPGPGPEASDGTITGTVRGPEGSPAIDGRVVEAVNVSTGERQRAVTNRAGEFTLKVRPGRYRVELTLRGGERLARQPGTLDVTPRNVDAHADFVLRGTRVSRPRTPAYRTADGLGSPVA